MPYLAGYKNDVFVSYAHGRDDQQLKDWSWRLKKRVSDYVPYGLPHGKITAPGERDRSLEIWIDDRLHGNDYLTDSIKEAIKDSALLLVIMSNYFLESEVCREELHYFVKACEERGQSARGRIFVAQAFPTDFNRWPEELKDTMGRRLPGYEFYPRHRDASGINHPPVWPYRWSDTEPDTREFVEQLQKLSGDIAAQLLALEATPSHTVFLGYAGERFEVERNELRQELRNAGIEVLPPEAEDPVDEETLGKALERYLPKVDGVVLVADEYCTMWPRAADQPGGALSLQVQSAKRQSRPYYLWLMSDPAKARRPEYREYLGQVVEELKNSDIAVTHAKAPAFAKYVVGKLGNSVGLQPNARQQQALIFRNRKSDPDLGPAIEDAILQALSELNQVTHILDFDKPAERQIRISKMTSSIRDARSVLVLCFDEKWEWAEDLLRLLNSTSGIQDAGKFKVMVAGPRRELDLMDGRVFGFPTIDSYEKGPEDIKQELRRRFQQATMN
jgi:hypothetical protein